MRPATALAAVLAAALAGAPPAPAQDAGGASPGEKKPRVSASAAVAIDRIEKATGSALAEGLRSLAGVLRLDVEAPDSLVVGEDGAVGGRMVSLPGMPAEGIDYRLSFRAPSSLEVVPGRKVEGPLAVLDPSLRAALSRTLMLCLRGGRPAVEGDASVDVRTVGGGNILTVIRFENGAETGRDDMTLDSRGLPVSAILTRRIPAPETAAGPGGAAAKPVTETAGLKITWKDQGEGKRWRIEKVEVQDGIRAFAVTPSWVPLGTRVLPASLTLEGGSSRYVFAFTELAVDGARVVLPPLREKPKIPVGKKAGGEAGTPGGK